MKKRDLEPEEHTAQWTAMMGILGGRLLTLSCFLILLSFVFGQDGVAFYSFIAFAYIITIPYSLWMRNQDRMRQLAPLQFLVDLILVSGLIYFSGGWGHDFLILLYPLIILSAGIILPLKQTIQITVLAMISYTLVVLLMSQNILVGYSASGDPAELASSTGTMLQRGCIFLIFGIASAYVSRRCEYISKKEKQFGKLTTLVFEHVKTGLLLLDANDVILMANNRACVLLSRDEPGLFGKNLSSIHCKPSQLQPADTVLRGATDYFRRSDGSVFPVSIEDARLSLPAEAIPHAHAKSDTLVDARILNFNDLTHFLRLQGQTRKIERVQAAANMAKEMAHQIRTPLTVVSGAVQLLHLNLSSSKTEDVEKECGELCKQIVQESVRMDKVIQNFLDYAELSPKDVHNLIQMDIDWEIKGV